MTDPLPHLFSDDPAAAVLALPGVTAVFPVHVAAQLRETLQAAVGDPDPADRIELSTAGGVSRIRARIGADSTVRVPETGRAVATALLEQAPTSTAFVTVQIAHID